MEDQMKRRDFIALFVVAAAISTCPAYAEKGVLPVVGYLGFDSAEKSTELLVALREGLRTMGFVENQNVAIEYRFAEGKYDRFHVEKAESLRPYAGIFPFSGDRERRPVSIHTAWRAFTKVRGNLGFRCECLRILASSP
jgi:hypothetical protein